MDERRQEAVLDLEKDKAVEKMKELVSHNKICLFATQLRKLPIQVRPMSTQEVDDDGNLWFLSGKNSNKNFDLHADPRVQLFYASRNDAEFLSVYGRAKEIADRSKIEELWSPIAKAWFKEGKNDPELSVICVTPEDAYYWDTRSNKVISLFKIMASAVSDATMDDGVEGHLKIN